MIRFFDDIAEQSEIWGLDIAGRGAHHVVSGIILSLSFNFATTTTFQHLEWKITISIFISLRFRLHSTLRTSAYILPGTAGWLCHVPMGEFISPYTIMIQLNCSQIRNLSFGLQKY